MEDAAGVWWRWWRSAGHAQIQPEQRPAFPLRPPAHLLGEGAHPAAPEPVLGKLDLQQEGLAWISGRRAGDIEQG